MIVKEKDTTGNFQTKAYQSITNQRGDILSIRDQDDQEVGSYRYDAYGNVLSVEGDVAKDTLIRRIAGVTALRKSFGGWYLLGRFSVGIYQGGRNKYFRYAPCYRSAYTYGS